MQVTHLKFDADFFAVDETGNSLKDFDDILSMKPVSFSENVFEDKKIPFRTFYIKKRNEETLGELFCFFTLEVILLSHLLKINPLNQPSVELVKKETFKILKK